jgi:hypothetical protein
MMIAAVGPALQGRMRKQHEWMKTDWSQIEIYAVMFVRRNCIGTLSMKFWNTAKYVFAMYRYTRRKSAKMDVS